MLKIFILTLLALFACATSQALPTNCNDAILASGRNGIHQIQLKSINNIESAPLFVYCEADKAGGKAWTIIQRRQDGSINFERNWIDYRFGFGNTYGEFFIGLDNLYALTHSALHELWVQLEDFDNATRYARYDSFAIGSASQGFALNVLGQYAGNSYDSMRNHQGMKFSTFDIDNDASNANCAEDYKGGWWYNNCLNSNLNGLYLRGEYPMEQYAQGVCWLGFRGLSYSHKYVHMAIRAV